LRWGWGSTKVSNFLKTLSDLDMINQRQTGGQTIIKLSNYGTYNDNKDSSKPPDKPEANQRQTSGKPEANQSKEREEYNKLNNLKNNNPPLPSQTEGKGRIDSIRSKFYDLKEGMREKEGKEGEDKQPDEKQNEYKSGGLQDYINTFNTIRSTKFKAIEKVRKQYNARLKEGFTPAQMIESLKNAMKDEYHIETGYKYLTPEFFTRSDKIDKFLNTTKPSTNQAEENFNKSIMNKLEKLKNENRQSL
jgi:hypothetical protein